MRLPQVSFLVILMLLKLSSAHTIPKIVGRAPRETAGSSRRGVAYNDVKFVKYFDLPGSRVTWAYNWDSRANGDFNTWYEFVPMLHSNRPDHTGKWAAAITAAAFANKDAATHFLGFNEPDNCEPNMGGACMDLGSSVAAWKQFMEPALALKEKIYLGSPAVTNGPQGLAYLSSFLTACTGCTIHFIALHWYDSATNVPYFKAYIEEARKVAAGRPIWITEFQVRGSDDQVKAFLDEVLPWLDAAEDVHRYAYFMAAARHGQLIDIGGASLSNIGTHYTLHG
ncbi:hypothetical protein OPT61_g6693 [Boeremia exigua]|uniref:Uncharacterized protein n=1 Tax=Boeremia exigua TaxID=749465 RepID=A0ACC2I630_9PLEO|nr:hypothetical protein OPT61_g6693 [Boeremia exigua]